MVTVIFTNLRFQEILNKANKFIKNNRVFKYVSCFILSLAAVVMTVSASGLTFGYNVSYQDKVIAVVSSRQDFKSAEQSVLNQLDEKTANKASASPKFGLTLTVAQNFYNKEDIIKAIINNNDNIVEATAILLNGEPVICSEGEEITNAVNQRLTEYYVDGAENTSEFEEDIEVVKGYYLKSDLADLSEIKEYVSSLNVKTVSVVTKKIEIPFETTNIKTNKKPVGFTKITKEGENGIAEKTQEIVSLNGKVTVKNDLAKTIIKEQSPKIVTVGTGVKYVNATVKANIASAGFICPIRKGSYIVSAYYGDGRNHKGIDLAARCGTPIFAAAGGKVVYAGYDSDYGYNVIVKHSNGMKTRYAHANALCVKNGATVSQGDMIATVGNTGWSTGDHLHFEIIIGGNRVNPGPYIGLR